MPRPGITYESVAQAAQELLDLGERPTIKNVRARLHTGSPNTIHRHLKRWKATNPNAKLHPTKLSLEFTAALFAELQRYARAVNTKITQQLEQAETENNELKQQLQEQKNQHEHHQTQQNQQNTRHQRQTLKHTLEIKENRKEIKRLQNLLEKEKHLTIKHSLQRENQQREYHKAQQTIEKLKKENQTLKAQLAIQRKAKTQPTDPMD
ncbi:DNA-binding protein [Thiorhodospira sibirica]|uniref:DNA-binding protein n=1 Tax=Thiorhodospira sibirica TaxID=154347 RepID=UPI00022C5889|nr:DNA-binding protein [Thiorhodospira sibirica]